MADYKETRIAARKYRRCVHIEIRNPLPPGVASIVFREQDVVEVDGADSLVSGRDQVVVEFDQNKEFWIYGPNGLRTGETMTHRRIYNLLQSLYLSSAVDRDQAKILAEEAEAARRAAAALPPPVIVPPPEDAPVEPPVGG